MTERLPLPDWGRDGETWRVEPEDAVPWRTDVHGLMCRCELLTSRWRITAYRTCREHLREQNMWIEDGIVVSWRLSR